MEKKKRNILIILSIVLVLITILVIYLFSSNKKEKNYPQEPISQETIYPSNEKIELKETFSETDKPIYTLSNKTQLENVKRMTEVLGLDIKTREEEEAEYYNWTGNGWSFIYDLSSNYLIFNIEEGIEVGEVELNKNSFSNFVNKYFSKDWKYTVFETEKRSGGEVVSYAKRKINTDDVVESKIFNKYTDYLALKDGKIIYGKILLTDFEETELDAPLIDSTKLNELINIKGYPKEVFADYSVLQSSVLKDVDYLSDEFEELADTLSNCVSSSNSVVYLYKSFSQTYLTPIYKIDMQCTVEYNSQQYSIPAVAYVNAIDPEYISIPE